MIANNTNIKHSYFYRCPIKAAFMAKYHGVKFTNGDSLRSACEAIGNNGRDLQAEGAFYISNPKILNPHPDDLVFTPGADGDPDGAWPYCVIMNCERIVERDGTPFLWPESEKKRPNQIRA